MARASYGPRARPVSRQLWRPQGRPLFVCDSPFFINLLLVCVESHGSEPPGVHKWHLGLNHADELQRNLWV